MTALRIHLENRGQRFHTFTLRDGLICDANAEGWLWNGSRVVNDTIGTGTILRLTDARDSGVIVPIRWPVQAVFMAPDLPPTIRLPPPRHSRNAVTPGAAASSPSRAGAFGGGAA